MSKDQTVFSFILNAIKPFKFYVALHLFVVIYAAIELSLSPFLAKIFLDKLASVPRLEVISETWVICSLLIFIILLNGAIWRICDYSWMKLSPRLRKKITVEAMDYATQHSFSFFQNNFAGSLANRVRDLAEHTQQILERVLYNFLVTGLSLVFALLALLSANKFFAFAMIVWAMVFILIAIRGGKIAAGLGIPTADQQTKISGTLVDILSNISNVKLFSRNWFERCKISDLQDEYTKFSENKNRFLLKFFAVSAIGFCLYAIFCLVALLYFYELNMVTLGDFFMVFSINNWIIFLMWTSAQEFRGLLENIGVMNQALKILNEPLEIKDKGATKDLLVKKGIIEFQNITFAYKNSPPLFCEKNIIIEAGQKVGLVGHSGSGKTTFVNLILRVFDVDSGRILIDGQDISEVSQDSLRASIGMIPQDPSLFHRPIFENIAYGKIEATKEEIMEAAQKAYADEFIKKLPQGYDSMVGERGIRLSGGQRQRISIARAFLKNAPILILDEATSQLDSITENLIQESLKNLMQGKTTLVIAHRLSTLKIMDRILVFDRGKIVEDGKHEELLVLNGVYKKLWDAQIGGVLTNQVENAEAFLICGESTNL